MQDNLIANVEVYIAAPIADVWNALIDPVLIKQYMFGSEVISDWQVGSPITWKGEWNGNPFEDSGEVLAVEPVKMLKYSHTSPAVATPEKPQSTHVVTIELVEKEDGTDLMLSQDSNATVESMESSKKNWLMMLGGLKDIVEKA